MNVSLTTLVKFLLANPEHLPRLRTKIQDMPDLVNIFDTLSIQTEIAVWSEWLEQAGQQIPSLIPSLLHDLQSMGDETSLTYEKAPEPTNIGPLLAPATSSEHAPPAPFPLRPPTPLPHSLTPAQGSTSALRTPLAVPTPLPKPVTVPGGKPGTLSWIPSSSSPKLEAPLFGNDDLGESTMMEDGVVPPVLTFSQTEMKPISSPSHPAPKTISSPSHPAPSVSDTSNPRGTSSSSEILPSRSTPFPVSPLMTTLAEPSPLELPMPPKLPVSQEPIIRIPPPSSQPLPESSQELPIPSSLSKGSLFSSSEIPPETPSPTEQTVQPPQPDPLARTQATPIASASSSDAFPQETSRPEERNLQHLTGDEKKQIAQENSRRVYASGLGWHRFQLDPLAGKILPESPAKTGAQWLHCRIEQDQEGLVIRELHLHLSLKQILVYQNLLWYWKYPPNPQLFRTDIESIAKTLPAVIVDFLLDLVSPGLFVQAADAHLSHSFSQAIVPQPGAGANPSSGVDLGSAAVSSHILEKKSNPSNDATYGIGDNAVLVKSPFAVRPISSDLGETTLTRQAVLEPLQPPPQPTYVSVLQEIQPNWFQRWLDKWFPHPTQFETVSVLRVGETQDLSELGLSVTFLIESTSHATFPWLRITRDAQLHRDATVTLLWNQEQKQILPPNCKSTGALSRSTEKGTLQIQFEQHGYQPLRLHIRWS